nr:uncharacterized protein MAL8P1.12-like [Lepeophtheirus salmonis]
MHLSKKVGSEQKFKPSYDNNKEAITKMELTIGRLISNDLPNLTIRLKDCESTIDKQVSSAEHDVRIDALHKEFEKKYDSLKSDLFNELKNCENVYDDQIKVLREGIECVVSKTEGYIDKNRFENLIENTRKETVELRENMGKIIKQDEENTKNIISLEQSSTTMAKEIKNCTELSLKKASELENAQKKMDELKKGDDLLLNSVNKLQNQVNGIVKEIKDCQTKGKELSSNLESVKNVFEEERKEEKLNISKLETSLGKTLKSQEKIEKELSSNKDNLAEQVRSKVEFCSDSLKKEINFCKKELNCCRNEVSDMGKDIIKHLEDEKLHINSSFKPFNKDIETMNHKITSCLGDMNKWNKKLDTFHQEFTLGLNKVKDDSISVKKEVAIDFEASLQENSVCLQKMIHSFMKSTEQDINKHNQKIKEIDNENQIMKNKVSEALSGTTFVSKKDLKDIQKNLINDIKSASEQFSGIKADFDDFKLSEKSKYTLLDKKQKDINTFCEDINATIYRTEEDIKDIRLDVSVDSNTINELKMKISGINESKDKFEHLSRKVEECFERDLDQTNSFNSFKEDLAQFKSSIQTSSKGVNALEDKYANDFLSVKKRIDGLVTSKKIRDKLIKDVERIDKKLEQYHEKVMDKIDTNKYSFENDLQLSQEKISLSENSIQKLDKRMDDLHENEVKSRENIAPLICNFKEAMDANFTYVIQHVMENQKFIDSIRKLMEESTQAESAGKSPS